MNQALHVEAVSAAPAVASTSLRAGEGTQPLTNNHAPQIAMNNNTPSTPSDMDIPRPKINRAPRALMVIEKKEQSPFDVANAKSDTRLGQWDFKFAVSLIMLVVFINLSLTLLLGNSAKAPGAASQDTISFQGQLGGAPATAADNQDSQMYLPKHTSEQTTDSSGKGLDESASPSASPDTQKLLSIINRY